MAAKISGSTGQQTWDSVAPPVGNLRCLQNKPGRALEMTTPGPGRLPLKLPGRLVFTLTVADLEAKLQAGVPILSPNQAVPCKEDLAPAF